MIFTLEFLQATCIGYDPELFGVFTLLNFFFRSSSTISALEYLTAKNNGVSPFLSEEFMGLLIYVPGTSKLADGTADKSSLRPSKFPFEMIS